MDSPELNNSATAIPSDRKLTVLVHADMVGYSRLIARDDTGTMTRLAEIRKQVMEPEVLRHRGRIIQIAGDSLMMIFESIDRAVECAIGIQTRIPVADADHPVGCEIRFRFGVNVGDVVADDSGYHGDGINVAARLQQACPIGGVCISRSVHDLLRSGLRPRFEPLGALKLKNIIQPVEAYSLRQEGIATPRATKPDESTVIATPEVLASRPAGRLGRLRALFAGADLDRKARSVELDHGHASTRFNIFERSNDFLAAGDDMRLPALLGRARHEVWMVGSTFYITVGQYRSLILDKLAQGVAVHFLIQRPGGKALPTMAALLGVTSEELALDCLSGIRVLQRTLADAKLAGLGGLLRVRLLDEPFQTRFYLFDPQSPNGWIYFVPQIAGIKFADDSRIPGAESGSNLGQPVYKRHKVSMERPKCGTSGKLGRWLERKNRQVSGRSFSGKTPRKKRRPPFSMQQYAVARWPHSPAPCPKS